MHKILSITLLILTIILNVSPVQAEAEYNTLPKLDGKVDKPINTQQYTIKEPKLNIAASNTKIAEPANKENPDSVINFDTPKLDLQASDLSKTYKIDSLGYAKYQNDLNAFMKQLIDLQNCIKEGATVQVFSAKATTTKMLGAIFTQKYQDKTESNYESFKLTQDIINTTAFVRDYWVKSNKITYNQHGIPDKIIQTKFLRISTGVDKLIKLSEIKDSLSSE